MMASAPYLLKNSSMWSAVSFPFLTSGKHPIRPPEWSFFEKYTLRIFYLGLTVFLQVTLL